MYPHNRNAGNIPAAMIIRYISFTVGEGTKKWAQTKRKNNFSFGLSNWWSSESHRACTFGRVVTEENVVNESTLGAAKVRKVEWNTKEKVTFLFISETEYLRCKSEVRKNWLSEKETNEFFYSNRWSSEMMAVPGIGTPDVIDLSLGIWRENNEDLSSRQILITINITKTYNIIKIKKAFSPHKL